MRAGLQGLLEDLAQGVYELSLVAFLLGDVADLSCDSALCSLAELFLERGQHNPT